MPGADHKRSADFELRADFEPGLLAAMRPLLGSCKLLKAVLPADALPSTSTGKIRKNAVRDAHAGRFAAGQ